MKDKPKENGNKHQKNKNTKKMKGNNFKKKMFARLLRKKNQCARDPTGLPRSPCSTPLPTSRPSALPLTCNGVCHFPQNLTVFARNFAYRHPLVHSSSIVSTWYFCQPSQVLSAHFHHPKFQASPKCTNLLANRLHCSLSSSARTAVAHAFASPGCPQKLARRQPSVSSPN